MRDALAYILAGKTMAYTPRVRFCELVINGNYQGVYVLAESIKRDSARVNISKLGNLEVSGDAVTGGYILKIDKSTGGSGTDGWQSQHPITKTFYQFHYPKPADIVSAQRQYISDFMLAFEQMVESNQFSHPLVGYPAYIDVDSFVDFLLINELSRNVDGYRLSTFMYKDKYSKGGKLKMGPVWDFNITFGNSDYCQGGNTDGFAYNFNQVCGGDYWQIPFWWGRLTSDHSFRQRVGVRWQALRQGVFSNASLISRIDSISNLLTEPAARNFQKWPILGNYVWPNSFVGSTYGQEVNYLKTWITDRTAWLDNAFVTFSITATEPLENKSIQIIPNPSGNNQDIVFSYFTESKAEISFFVYDSKGKRIHQMTEQQDDKGWHQTIWSKLDISNGTYYFQVFFNGKDYRSGRIIRK